ncbi:hypothetical protein BURPS668_A2383 [Burkholderia pseudomallei 668]|nr:hypothetical protein BURPS668_A2383 [Burkholderia pseudomallei 668]
MPRGGLHATFDSWTRMKANAGDQRRPCPMSFETSKMTNEIHLPLRLYL